MSRLLLPRFAERARDADRAALVTAEREVDLAGRDQRRAPARGPARGPGPVPRAADRPRGGGAAGGGERAGGWGPGGGRDVGLPREKHRPSQPASRAVVAPASSSLVTTVAS